MSIEDTIKSLEEADEKIKKAVVLEQKGVAAQKDAARLREESQSNLDKVRIERANFDKIQAERESASQRKEEELKNREVKLSSGQATLERKTAESNKTFETSYAALDARTVAVDKTSRQNKEFEETLDKRAAKYHSIAEFINKAL